MRRLHIKVSSVALAYGAVLLASVASATIIVPVATQDLADSSEVVVVGTVAAITYGQLDDGRIVTGVTIEVEETWKGTPHSTLSLLERGGIVGDRGEIVHGSPSYQSGEPVVVFASRTVLGWRTNHMLQGKFRIEIDEGGTALAVRELDPGVAVLAGTSSGWRSAIPLQELETATRRSPASLAALSPVAHAPIEIVGDAVGDFTTQNNNPRFFESDLGEPYVFVIDDRGDSILGLEVSRRAVDDAFAAWNAISGSSLVLIDGGLTNDIGSTPIDGVHRVLFDDPNDDIFPPTNCSGTLGQGGSTFSLSETKTFGGITFNKITSGFLRFADGWDGCEQWTECNFSEVAGHEIGHAFGLGHPSESVNEPNQDFRDALMYFRAHFDGRCADPRTDDINGIRAVYPADAPPSVATSSPLPQAVIRESYRVELEAANATPPLTWESAGMGCPSPDDLGLSLNADGVLEGTIPNFSNAPIESCLTIRLTDANGESHAKRLTLPIVREPSPDTPTPSPTNPIPTSTPRPTDTPVPPTATQTNTPTNTIPAVRPCIGDCDGDGELSINELIRGVNIALGRAELSSCPSFDRDGNGTVAINELIAAVTAALFGCTT